MFEGPLLSVTKLVIAKPDIWSEFFVISKWNQSSELILQIIITGLTKCENSVNSPQCDNLCSLWFSDKISSEGSSWSSELVTEITPMIIFIRLNFYSFIRIGPTVVLVLFSTIKEEFCCYQIILLVHILSFHSFYTILLPKRVWWKYQAKMLGSFASKEIRTIEFSTLMCITLLDRKRT